ncbi:MAG: response regulator [Myxococcota bacterium]
MTPSDHTRIGEILTRNYGLGQAQLDRAVAAQGRTLQPLVSTCIEVLELDPDDGARALGEQFGVPAVSLDRCVLDLEPLSLVPAEIARSHRVLPLGLFGGRLRLAMARPDDRALLDEVSFASGYGALPFVVPRATIDRVIAATYEARAAGSSTWRGEKATHEGPQLEVLTPVEEPAIAAQLPQDGLESFPEAPAPKIRPSSGKPQVLAVDDEPEILDIIEKALSHKGMEVLRATRGREALDVLRGAQPDVILLDAMLPEIHGFELCQQIKQSDRYKDTPVMMISAIYTGWNFIQDVKRIYGADEYMTKPFRIVELVKKVQELLGQSTSKTSTPADVEVRRRVQSAVRACMEHLAAGQAKEALEYGATAVREDPFDARAHFAYGTTLHRMGRVYEAISEFERVVELVPQQFNALKNLAVLYERQGFKAKAVEMWTRALEKSPSEPVRKTIKAHLIDLL